MERQGEVFIGGYCNTVNGNYGGTFSGYCNTVSAPYGAVIGGGYCNIINGGDLPGNYSFIGGGCANTLSNNYGSVLGGCQNTMNGEFSTILGGSGNTVSAAYQYAGVFGCNVAAVASCAFHANNFVAQDIYVAINLPQYNALPNGALYTCAPPLSGFLNNPIFIK